MLEHTVEEAHDPLVSPVQMYPFCNAETQDDIIFCLCPLQYFFTFPNVIPLYQGIQNAKGLANTFKDIASLLGSKVSISSASKESKEEEELLTATKDTL